MRVFKIPSIFSVPLAIATEIDLMAQAKAEIGRGSSLETATTQTIATPDLRTTIPS